MLSIPADVSTELTAVLKEMQDAIVALQADVAALKASHAEGALATADTAATETAAV